MRAVAIVHPAVEPSAALTFNARSVVVNGKAHRLDKVCQILPSTAAAASTQESIYTDVAAPLVEKLLNGSSASLLAVGTLASGKTFTVTGGAQHFSDRGLIPRALTAINRSIDHAEVKVHLAFFEIYKDRTVDLLAMRGSRVEEQEGRVAAEPTDTAAPGVKWYQTTSESDMYQWLFAGDGRRHFERTSENPEASRGHAVFQIRVTFPHAAPSTLTLADLILPAEHDVNKACVQARAQFDALEKFIVGEADPDTPLVTSLGRSLLNSAHLTALLCIGTFNPEELPRLLRLVGRVQAGRWGPQVKKRAVARRINETAPRRASPPPRSPPTASPGGGRSRAARPRNAEQRTPITPVAAQGEPNIASPLAVEQRAVSPVASLGTIPPYHNLQSNMTIGLPSRAVSPIRMPVSPFANNRQVAPAPRQRSRSPLAGLMRPLSPVGLRTATIEVRENMYAFGAGSQGSDAAPRQRTGGVAPPTHSSSQSGARTRAVSPFSFTALRTAPLGVPHFGGSGSGSPGNE